MSQPFRPYPTPGDYGQRWGEGAARCFSLEGDFDEDEGLRLLPIPESFICPMTQTVMEDPVMTVDGCTYERSYIEQWIRHRRQQNLRVTSPLTNEELPSHRLLSLTALRKAIEAYLAHRPELVKSQMTSRSFEEAAQLLQGDLLEKQQMAENTRDELSLLRDSNEVLYRAVHQAEGHVQELETTVHALRDELTREQKSRATLQESRVALESECAALKDSAKTPAMHIGSFLVCALLLLIAAPALQGEHRLLGWPLAATVPPLPTTLPLHEDSGLAMSSLPPLLNATVAEANETPRAATRVHRRPKKRTGSPRRKEQAQGVAKEEHAVAEELVMEIEVERWAEISRAPDNMDDNEAIRKQVELLYDGSLDEKTEAALVLGVLAATSQVSQVKIVREGAVAPLVALLSSGAPEARGQAAVALKTLASNNTYNKVVIVRAGAIPLLIKLLKDDSMEVQEVAEGALQLLAEFNNQVEIAQAGAIVPLVALLKDSQPGVREEAVGALVLLSLNADNQVAIAQVGAIPMLVDLLKDEVADVREQAAAALRNLAAENVDNQREIAKAGALAPLTDLMKDERLSVRKEALGALRNMAVDKLASDVSAEVAAALAGHTIQEAADGRMPEAKRLARYGHTGWDAQRVAGGSV
mmetsp:Transcript_48116/g.112507  ORF Transcript_48116/g.112507 Transcript_48116/m.112507 type:complete len:642 (+) Transcript_48116:82-2007(+)